MSYFRLVDDVHVSDRWHLGTIINEEGDEPLLDDGLEYAGSKLLGAISRPGRPLDFCLTSFGVPVASSHLAESIARMSGQAVQRIPLSLGGHDSFEVLNVIRTIRCVDEARSDFTKWTERDHRADLAGQYRMITKLVLTPTAVAGEHIFRVKDWPIGLIVSDDMKRTMEKAGCLGAKFLELA